MSRLTARIARIAPAVLTLADAGIEARMAHPFATKAIGAGRVKNDPSLNRSPSSCEALAPVGRFDLAIRIPTKD